MNAFGGLFMASTGSGGLDTTPACGDAAAGGDQRQSGCRTCDGEKTAPLQPPLKPTPATRMPRRTRRTTGLERDSVEAREDSRRIFSSSESSSSSSLHERPMSAATSNSPQCPHSSQCSTPLAVFGSQRPRAEDASRPSQGPSVQAWWAALMQPRAEPAEHSQHLHDDGLNASPTSPASSPASRAVFGNAVTAQKANVLRESVDLGDCCCFRDSRALRSKFGSIREDRPQMHFDDDVLALDLRSILRRNGVEPSDALVADVMSWRARGSRANNANSEGGTGGPP
mmetsp:Transcript_81363/g.226593  ORF Transcript_81363/g.226593 Transcript_81363/m.226593 type:complete len:284 (-) Transcript_81363:156-1007(-)